MDQAQMIGIAVGIGFPALLLLIVFIKSHMVICQPNELVVLAGRRHKVRGRDGEPDRWVGYRVLRGGYGFQRPFFESVARLPLTGLPIELQLARVMCRGMIPVTVEGRANVKLAGRPEDGMELALERFLGKGPEAVRKAAEQALAGAVRGVMASRSPEEANIHRLDITREALGIAREQLKELGVVVDFLQIQEITDDRGYLEAVGRQQAAAVERDARIAEAQAEAQARREAAEQRRVGREAEITAELAVLERENALEVRRAELAIEEQRASQQVEVSGKIARTEKQIVLEEKRAELVQRRERAQTIIPAEAAQEAARLAAEGAAARIREDGRATAEALALMKAQWEDGATKDLFMIQMLPTLLDKVTSVVSDNLRIDKLTVLDGGSGEGLPNAVKNLTNSAVVMMEQVQNAAGVDLGAVARSLEAPKNGGGKGGGDLPRELD